MAELIAPLKEELKKSDSLALLEEVEKRFAEQESQIQELRRYKEKWRNLKRDARKNASTLSSSPARLELSSSLSNSTSTTPTSDKKA